MITFPFMTSYDPPGTSEGTLDPLGLYQIADQLAVKLVPAVRERMQRIRFLTAMAVGTLITEGLGEDARQRDASPYLGWEWLVVEALIRNTADDSQIWGVPGTLVTRRALSQHGYLDARSYLKTPRVFGFHGVYKRLAIHLGIVNVHLGPGPNTQGLVDAWARDLQSGGLADGKPMVSNWSAALRRSMNEKPPRTKSGWSSNAWDELARAFTPAASNTHEKRYLRKLLLSEDDRRLGALPILWQLQAEFKNDEFQEETLHRRLEERAPEYGLLLKAIRAYEAFARSLQDAFDVLKAEASEASRLDAQGFEVSQITHDDDFKQCAEGLHDRYGEAYRALGEVTMDNVSIQNLFAERFSPFCEPVDAGKCASELCGHHETIQQGKSADGKRPWFIRTGPNRIYIRHDYRDQRRPIQPDRYVHDYRGWPIRRFYKDLT